MSDPLLCRAFGHKLALDAENLQEYCARWGCTLRRDLTALEAEYLLDAEDDAGKCHEPEAKQGESCVHVPF